MSTTVDIKVGDFMHLRNVDNVGNVTPAVEPPAAGGWEATMSPPTPPRLTLGQWLRIARERAGYTQQRAADAIGVSRPLVTQWERDENDPRIHHVARMVTVYDAAWLWQAVATVYMQGDEVEATLDLAASMLAAS